MRDVTDARGRHHAQQRVGRDMGARGPLIDCDPTLWREAGCPTESQPVADGVALGDRSAGSCG